MKKNRIRMNMFMLDKILMIKLIIILKNNLEVAYINIKQTIRIILEINMMKNSIFTKNHF
jgi:hypothetical protein